MQIKSTFKNMEHTTALDEKIKEKSQKFECYFQGKSSFHWICWMDSLGEYHAEVKAVGPHFEFFAKATHDNLYKCFDLVSDKLERQFEKHKSKVSNRIHNQQSWDKVS